MIQKLSNMVLPPYLFSAAFLQSRIFWCSSVGVKSVKLVGAAPYVTCNHCYMEKNVYKQRFAPTFFAPLNESVWFPFLFEEKV